MGTDAHTCLAVYVRVPRSRKPPASSSATICGAASKREPPPQVARAIKKHKLEVVRFSFADQHGVLRGKTLLAGGSARRAMRDGVSMTTTLLAKDTAHRPCFRCSPPAAASAWRRCRAAADFMMLADPATFRVLPWAPQDRLDAVRHLFRQRQAGAVLDARTLSRGARTLAEPASISSPGSRSNSICSSWKIRGSRPPTRPGRREPPEVSLLTQGYQYLTETRYDMIDPALEILRAQHRSARPAAALGRGRARAEPGRIHLPPAAGLAAADSMMLFRSGGEADRAPQRLSRDLHVPAGSCPT